MRSRFLPFGVAVALAFSVSTPAHAQFGKLGDAIKKKAKEVGAQATGKEEPKKDDAAPSAKPPAQMLITTDVLDSFAKGLNAESTKRGEYVKREQCSQSAIQSNEYMQMLAAQGEEMGKQMKDDLTDAQKTAVMMKAGEEMQKKQLAFIAKKCGPVVERMDDSALEQAGAEVSGFTPVQYAALKERTIAYCEAVARGSDTAADSRIAFTDAEMQALKPRCSTLLKELKRNT